MIVIRGAFRPRARRPGVTTRVFVKVSERTTGSCRRPNGERGSVLLCTLMVITLIATLGAALSLVISTESVVAANYHTSQQGLYAAEAGIEHAIGEIRSMSLWNSLPSSVTSSSDFNDGQSIARGPDGSTLDLSRLTIKRQAESDAMYPMGRIARCGGYTRTRC